MVSGEDADSNPFEPGTKWTIREERTNEETSVFHRLSRSATMAVSRVC
jgi:hypothetical protein